jgi:soluble lytic murein transglycosylase-like protein
VKRGLTLPLIFCAVTSCWAQSPRPANRPESEYYVAAYAQHYGVPIPLVRAIVERESSWRPCAVSPKGAVGLMQLMPATAQHLGVADRCNIDQNVSGGVRYLARLVDKFHGDLRLATAAYYAGENIIGRRGLAYCNPEVVAYVSHIRATYLRFAQTKSGLQETTQKRDIR